MISAKPTAWIQLQSEEAILSAAGSERPYDFGYVGAMFRLICTHPRLGAAFRPLFHQVMVAPGHLSRAEREMVAAVTAAAQDCTY